METLKLLALLPVALICALCAWPLVLGIMVTVIPLLICLVCFALLFNLLRTPSRAGGQL